MRTKFLIAAAALLIASPAFAQGKSQAPSAASPGASRATVSGGAGAGAGAGGRAAGPAAGAAATVDRGAAMGSRVDGRMDNRMSRGGGDMTTGRHTADRNWDRGDRRNWDGDRRRWDGDRHGRWDGDRHNRWHRHGHRHWRGPVLGFGFGYNDWYGSGFYDDGAYAYDTRVYVDRGDRDDAYCSERFRSYDPRTGTYLGYDGQRHPCP